MVEKNKSLRNFLKLPDKKRQAIILLFSGNMTQAKIADEVNVSATTLSTWKTHEDFRLGQDEYTRFMLHDLSSKAVLTMKELLNARSEMVRYNAASYVIEKALSSGDEARKSKAEADIMEAKAKRETSEDTSNITINIKPIQQDGGDDSANQH